MRIPRTLSVAHLGRAPELAHAAEEVWAAPRRPASMYSTTIATNGPA
jgi:hypothetical protein